MWFKKKKSKTQKAFEENYPELADEEKDDSGTDASDANADATDGDTASSNGPQHAMGDGSDGVPQALKDTLAKIRGSQEPEFKDIEVDEDGNPLNAEDAALLDGNAVVKDDDSTSGDAVNQDSTSDSKPESEDVDGSDGDYEEVELDPRLEEAGKAMGWSPEKIALVAGTDVTILEDIATRLDASETHRQGKEDAGTDGDTEEQGGLVDEEALAKVKEKLGDEADTLIDAIVKGVSKKFEGKFKAIDEDRANTAKEKADRAAIQRGSIADEVFDSAAEQFEEFGTTKSLPKDKDTGKVLTNSPQMKLRAKVYQVASMFHQANGGTFEQAMREAVQHYAGGQGTNAATRQVVKDLKKNRTRFTPKPTGRKTVRVFKNTDGKKSHIVQEAMRKAGIK
jgi:hypothetical protein